MERHIPERMSKRQRRRKTQRERSKRRLETRPSRGEHGANWQLGRCLDDLERWAHERGYWMIRETESIGVGRIDALLVPVSFEAHVVKRGKFNGLVGVEVKLRRPDFLRGLREGQFARYAEKVNGLFLLAAEGIARASEIDRRFGFMVWNGDKVRCARHPTYTKEEPDAEIAWRLLSTIRVEFEQRLRRMEREYESKMERAGHLIAGRVMSAVRRIVESPD